MSENHLQDLELALGLAPKAKKAEKSPFVTNKFYCPACGNNKDFIGVDTDGYGGLGACKGFDSPEGCPSGDPIDSGYCGCTTTLTQPFHTILTFGEKYPPTLESWEVQYDAFTGGSYGSVIGIYDQVKCAKCDNVIWDEANE